ncbi:similar to Saccharomyces cerevisiae YLR067C PET309 Specific translational activator for the COX1 mRNA, also influences stability of intron-containing COX1 primary transcripts [Maudiozyma saulgeensis]|uniref:Similar to Saccharomyces cerevisiae YLR067C PET309 Specific translational activator for the COX1 mRNA, also influences stability of intron-containing COX1 primary transcripts n=1 Tax=Maudiozyma saulgeensis TaxID=1789683 RepID=A0A1X7R3K6_9SACH|nr:similar to Saccharomyces cerevisiae YLR067C PET309 Specific translational activator for the COX1 mRNA, also influences stability of intron-containing COX1 primary transcripts [Kazachstania saulgeensis]
MNRPVVSLTYNRNGKRIVKKVPSVLRQILSSDNNIPLTSQEKDLLFQYFVDSRLTTQAYERQWVLDLLRKRGAHEVVLKFGRRHLFVINKYDTTMKLKTPSTTINKSLSTLTPVNIPKNNDKDITSNYIPGKRPTILIKDDVVGSELRTFIYSLISMRHTRELDTFMQSIISQVSLDRRGRTCDLISSVFNGLMNVAHDDPDAASRYKITDATTIDRWVKWVILLNGSCEFVSYADNRDLLRRILNYLTEKKRTDDDNALFESLSEGLDLVNKRQGITASSQFATTLIYLASYCKNFELVEQLWKYKTENKFPIYASDLTTIMRAYNYKAKFNEVAEAYESYPEAHHDASQFDYLLLAHAKTLSWTALKHQFDALFGIGKLPNIRHYEIVMYSMALLGNVKDIDRLYSQFLRRGMIPTYPILQSLLECHYKSSNPTECFQQFRLFEKYSIKPTAATYTIMFKVYRKLNDISSALRLLKVITEENNVPILEEHFVIIMQMCSRVTNHLIAREIFNIMKDHYDILPGAVSVSALMDVYTEAKQFDDAIKLFENYSKLEMIQSDPDRIAIYTSALYAKLKSNDETGCDAILEEVSSSNITMDSKFYKYLLMYMVNNLKDYDGANDLLKKLINNPKWIARANTSHFEVIMDAYSRISYHDGIFKLYNLMTDNHIPVNSKILYYLVKSTFKVQMSKKEDLTRSIEFVDKIMTNSAESNLYTSDSKFHPSIMGWALRAVAKYYSPKKALEMLNRYDKLFYDQNTRSVNNKFSLMRSLVVLFAELGDWEQFEIMYQNIWNQLERYEKQPTSTVPNIKLRSLFVGIFSYKIRHLKQTQQMGKLPELLNVLKNRNFVLDNSTWNQAILELASNDHTIKYALELTNEKFIHGYNIIHKNRLLTKLKNQSLSTMNDSWFLQKKKENPDSFIPKLYLESETFDLLYKHLDSYLNEQTDTEGVLKELIRKYGYFMKNYLMSSQHEVRNWDLIERNHHSYFQELRKTKRVIPVLKF